MSSGVRSALDSKQPSAHTATHVPHRAHSPRETTSANNCRMGSVIASFSPILPSVSAWMRSARSIHALLGLKLIHHHGFVFQPGPIIGAVGERMSEPLLIVTLGEVETRMRSPRLLSRECGFGRC